MAKNRKAAQDFIITYIEKVAPGDFNKQQYLDLFSGMDDNAFDEFMTSLEKGQIKLCVTAPNFSETKLSVENNFALAKELGFSFFERIWIPNKSGHGSYLSPNPYLVVDLPLRRQAQVLSKKISIPEDNNSVDDFTGQPTGKSKGSKISYPELQVLASIGLNESLTELMKFRGGDEGGFNAMNTIIDRTGTVTQKEIEPYSTGVKSTHSLKSFLTAMHLKTKGI